MAAHSAVVPFPRSTAHSRTHQRSSLPSREAQWPLTPSSIATGYVTRIAATAAAVAAWEADAIEPDVSSRSSLYASVQSSASTDGDSSDGSGRRRFRGLRVSLRRRPKAAFQYHVPVHLMEQTRFSRTTRTSNEMRFPTFTPDLSTQTRHRAPSAPPAATVGKESARRCTSDATTGPWGLAKPNVVELSDSDEPMETTDGSTSRRRRAWTKLKAHAKLPRMKRPTAPKGTTKMFSISFFPWKMEAHGYYSSPEAAVEWVPDTASSRCQLCYAGFNLARRRHHCRLCGRLVCNECSLQRTFLPFGEDALRRTAHRSLIKSGEPQRTCDSCTTTLKNMVAQQDHRVKEFCMEATTTTPLRQSKGPERPSFTHTRESQVTRPRGLSRARNDELDQVLQARAKSRASREGTRQHIVSSLWLEQWLQYVQGDTSDAMGHGRPSMASLRGSMTSRRRSSRFALGRRPGPIANYELLDFVNGKLVPRDGLKRSRGTDGTGDYHVISHEVWRVFLRLYGGGPCITVDEDAPPPTSLALMADTTLFEAEHGSPSLSLQWIITELDGTALGAPTNETSNSMPKDQTARMQPTPPSPPQQLTVRPTMSYGLETGKSSKKRPASATSITNPMVTPSIVRSTSESHHMQMNEANGERKSFAFTSYLKKWRQGDDIGRTSGTSTISHVDDDGVVLYDPFRYQVIEDDESDALSNSNGPPPQRETIAAVSAFAAAAAEARRKSTMSLMRHSTALPPRQPTHASIMTA